jgi:lipopolysaccharide transport system permease protein
MLMIVFTVFFARLAKVPTSDVPYPLFAYAGLLPWTMFAAAVTQAAQSVVNSERLITKVYFPRLVIPLAAIGSAVVDAAIAGGLLLVLMGWYGYWPGPGIMLAAGLLMVLVLAAAGVGTLLAALNVSFRDFRYVVPFLMQVWMFATPTIYMEPSAKDSSTVDTLLLANPIAPLIASFRAALLGGPVPWTSLGIAFAGSLLLFFLGLHCFRRMEDSFADIL